MKKNFNVKGKNGAIAIFVLVGLLFMTSFLIISYGYNVNKSKTAKEQFNIISDIYSHKDGDANAYERAYTALRKQNKQTLTKTVENTSNFELEKTYEENLSNYRIYGKGNPLTLEYEQLEYIQSTGTQYIDTEYYPNNTTKVESKINVESTITTTSALMGARTSTTSNTYTIFLKATSNYMRWDYANATISGGTLVEGDNLIIKDAQINYLNNNTLSNNAEKTFECEYPLYLFGVNTAGEFGSGSSIKMYYTKIYDNGSIVRDLVPCKRISDNVVGMYDRVNNIFYTSESDAFVAGTELSFTIGEDIGIGDLIEDISDENYGKYEIPIKITNSDGDSITTNIILDSPLYEGEYIDYKLNKAFRSDGEEEQIELPELKTFEDYTKFEIISENIPERIEIEYIGYIIVE